MHIEREQDDAETWVRIAPLLDAAIADLADRDRLTIVLRYFDGRSMKEIAKVLNTTEDAVKMRHHRAMEKLRRFFGRRGVVLSAGLLTSAMASHSVQAASPELESTLVAAATAEFPAQASAAALMRLVMGAMAWNQARVPVMAAALLVLAGGMFVMLHGHLSLSWMAEWHRWLMP